MNIKFNETFDFVELTECKTHNLLIKPKDVEEDKWLKVLVVNANKHSDNNNFSVTLVEDPTDIVVVVVHRSATDPLHANLFQENDFPLNQPVFLHLPAFDIARIIQKLQEFYKNTPLVSNA